MHIHPFPPNTKRLSCRQRGRVTAGAIEHHIERLGSSFKQFELLADGGLQTICSCHLEIRRRPRAPSSMFRLRGRGWGKGRVRAPEGVLGVAPDGQTAPVLAPRAADAAPPAEAHPTLRLSGEPPRGRATSAITQISTNGSIAQQRIRVHGPGRRWCPSASAGNINLNISAPRQTRASQPNTCEKDAGPCARKTRTWSTDYITI